MGSVDEEFQLLSTSQENGANLTCETSKCFSEIWLDCPSDGRRKERKFISENAAGDGEFAQRISTEEKGPCETALTPKGHWSDSESVNATPLPGSGGITTAAATTTATPPLLSSPSLSKADEALCDSSGSYHTAVCSVTPDNLSDGSGPFEAIEDLPTDSAPEGDQGAGRPEAKPLSEQGTPNVPEIGSSSPQCPPGPQCGRPEGDGEGFDGTWEGKACGGVGEREPSEWNGEMESCNSECGNQLGLDSGCEEERGASDGNHSSGCEAAPGWLEGRSVGFVDVASDSCSLTASSNSSGLAAISGSPKHDPRVGNRRGNGSQRQQVQLPISPENSQARRGCGGAGDQRLERNMLEQADIHPHPDPRTPKEMFRGDSASEARRKSYHRARCERAPAYCVSDTSSADENDIEVRRLTSLAFRSLSCPGDGYFDISNYRTDMGLSPSVSEEGNSDTDMWSAYRESEHCPIVSERDRWGLNPNDNARFTSSPELGERNKEMSDDAFDRTQFECVDVMMESQEGKGGKTASRTVPKRQIQLKKRERYKLKGFPPGGDTEPPIDLGIRRPGHGEEETTGPLGNVRENGTATESARTGPTARGKEDNNNQKCLPRASCTGDSVTKSKLASCLITNVILKKMQFERGLKVNPVNGGDSSFANAKDSESRDNASRQGRPRGSSSRSETRAAAEIFTGSQSPEAKRIPPLKDDRATGEPNLFSGERGVNGICHEKVELRNWKESDRDGRNDSDPDLAQEILRPVVIPSGRVPAEQGDADDKLRASQGERVDCFAKRDIRTWESGLSAQSKKSSCYQKTSRVLLSKRKASDVMFTSESPGIILTPPRSVSEKQAEEKGSGSACKSRTLPTLCRSGTEVEQDKVTQSDTGERISTEGKTEGPMHHVRGVRKLVGGQCDILTLTAHENELREPRSVSETQNTADAGNLNQRQKSLGTISRSGSVYGERKSESTFQVHDPSSEVESVSLAPSLNHSSQSNQSEPAVRIRALPPIVIECRSITRKRDNDTCLSVTEKYWACAGVKESSKVFSSDLKLPIPSDKHEKRRISTCATVSPVRCVTEKEDLGHFSGAKNPERRIQALSISSKPGSESSLRKNLGERNSCDGGEDANTHPACHVLTNETTDLRSKKEKQSELDLLTPEFANSGTTIKDVTLFGNVEPFGEFANQLGNQNQKISTVSSSTEGGAQITSCEGEERQEDSMYPQIPSQPSEHSTSTEGIVNHSQANSEHQKMLGRKLEAEDQPSRILCLENANVESPDGKSVPQSAIEVESENPDGLLSKSIIEQTSALPQRGKDVNRATDIQSKPFRNQSSDDKETQTPARKRRHRGDVTVRPEIPGKQVEDGTCDVEDDRALPHTEEEKIKHGIGLEEEDRFLGKSALDRTDGNLPSIGKEEAERPMAFGLDDGSEAGAHSVLSCGNMSSRREEHEIEERSDLDIETSPLGTSCAICEEVKPLSEESKGNGIAGANCLLGNTVSTETGNIRDASEMQVGLRGEDKLDPHCVGNSDGDAMSLATKKGKEDTKEPIAQTGQEEAEKTQSPVSRGVRFISEFQPVKDTCGVPVISGEVGEQNPPRSEGSQMGIEGNPLLPEPKPFPSGAADSQNSGRQSQRTGKSTCCEESADNRTSARALEAETLRDRSVLSPGVQRATQGKPPGALSPSTGYHGNSHPAGIHGVGFPTGKNPVRGRHPSLEVKSTREASAQCEAMFSSNAVNYLAIPVQVSPSPSPSPAPFRPSIPNSPQFQHGWETPLPHTAGSQTFPLHFLPEHRPLVAFPPHGCFVSPRPSDPVWPPQSVPFLPPPRFLDVAKNSPKLPLSSPVVDNRHRCSLFPFPPVQNKMLVDPETGKYYLVQAPVRSPRKMLLDPETGHYVDVIIPQQNYYQDGFSPYVLNPEVLRPPYMPGLQYPVMSMASTVVSPGQTPPRDDGVRVDNAPKPSHKYDGQKHQLSESNCIENLYYLPTGVTANPYPTQPSLQLLSTHSTHSKSHVKVTEDSTLILASQQSQGLSTLASCRTPTSFAVEQEQK